MESVLNSRSTAVGAGASKSLSDSPLRLRVAAIKQIAHEVSSFDLQSPDDIDLPTWSPGAYVNLLLPFGLVRSYSLVPSSSSRSYRIAVQMERAGRGGSRWLHENAQVGQELDVSPPLNHFPLSEGLHASVFIAGGIGITPLWSMIHRLERLNRDWTLVYRARNRCRAAYLDQLALYGDRVAVSFSDDASTPRPNLQALVAVAQPSTHFYCCGPQALLNSFEEACAGIPPDQVHCECFGVKPVGLSSPCRLVLARSGLEVEVSAGESLLTAVRKAGIDVPTSCEQGVCGACEIRILNGKADHKDKILTLAERDAQTSMMLCCSGALTPELELEL